MPASEQLLNSLIDIAHEAGDLIMSVYEAADIKRDYKKDKSPVTEADLLAHEHICSKLRQLTPRLTVISEESLNIDKLSIPDNTDFWLIDPLDGTRDFLKHNDEFTVNIALISRSKPVLGVVYAPALGLTYYAAESEPAWKIKNGSNPIRLGVHTTNPETIFTASRTKLYNSTKDWLKANNATKVIRLGSSLKLCYIADNMADIYPRLSPIMEWDIAAADAILRSAGGSIIETRTNLQPSYGKAGFKQGPFIAFGSKSLAEKYDMNKKNKY
jgi:3'(2'), 5'-bisphosphate nucleotidase